jgi:hypothetical protein
MAFGDSHFLQFVRVAAKFLFLLLFVQNSAAIAGEVKVWSGGVFRTVLIELGPQFERATGYKPSFEFGTSPAFARQIAAGQIFDVAILLRWTGPTLVRHPFPPADKGDADLPPDRQPACLQLLLGYTKIESTVISALRSMTPYP